MTKRRILGLLVVGSVAAVSVAGVAATRDELRFSGGDVNEGRLVFAQVCKSCHADTPYRRGSGPSLYRVVGREAGSVQDFDYSDAMKDAGFAWNDATLERYLADPKSFVRGNKMPYSMLMGAANEGRRRSVIAYLHTLE